jgi:hypothetical protein
METIIDKIKVKKMKEMKVKVVGTSPFRPQEHKQINYAEQIKLAMIEVAHYIDMNKQEVRSNLFIEHAQLNARRKKYAD